MDTYNVYTHIMKLEPMVFRWRINVEFFFFPARNKICKISGLSTGTRRRADERKQREWGEGGGGGTDKTLKEELFSTRACFLTPHERESRPGSERSLLLSVQ